MKLLKLVPDNTNIQFLKLRIPFFVLSIVLILGSWAAVAVNGLNFGVDFAGGQEVRMTFEERETAPIPSLRELVGGLGYGELDLGITSRAAAERILDERYLTVSTSFTTTSIRCSICGHDWAPDGPCDHTPGQAYEVADNGNRSSVHWDLVNIQRPEYGGGEIRFDGQLIRRNGQFVPKALHPLNY